MADKQLSSNELNDVLGALHKIQQMQSEINAKKCRPLSDDEVKRRVSRSDYGLSLNNPIMLNNVPLTHYFLQAIKSPSGTPFENEKRSSVQGEEGHIVDVYSGYYLDKDGDKVETKIYIDCYCARSIPVPPSGWFGKNEPTHTKKGCLVPLVLVIATICVAGNALARCLQYFVYG